MRKTESSEGDSDSSSAVTEAAVEDPGDMERREGGPMSSTSRGSMETESRMKFDVSIVGTQTKPGEGIHAEKARQRAQEIVERATDRSGLQGHEGSQMASSSPNSSVSTSLRYSMWANSGLADSILSSGLPVEMPRDNTAGGEGERAHSSVFIVEGDPEE